MLTRKASEYSVCFFDRSAFAATLFVEQPALLLECLRQICNGFASYRSAIENTLSDRVDFAQLIKVYRASVAGEARYSPAEVVSTEVVPVLGDPNPSRICTSHVERQNLTMRMQIRRFTRLTNGFSKKFENHWAALALYFAYYNFCRIHSSIRVTPAMEAKITDHVWDLEELLQ